MDQLLPRRLKFQSILEMIQGSSNVYFQPPENFVMQYPCIVYSRDHSYRISANNKGYMYIQRYQVTLISRDPDNPIVEQVGLLPQTTYLRGFVADGLTHDVFEIYY